MLKISSISVEKLRNNEFKKNLPEIYELKEVIENNNWHNNDSVFNHTLTTLEKLEELLTNAKNKISSYFNQKVDNYTRKQLLFLSAVFHDIAKKETLVENNNLTSCSNHEEMSSQKVKTILDRFDLSEKEKKLIIKTIKYHDKINIILESDNKELKEKYKEFKIKYPDIFLEITLLAIADTLGGQLKDNCLDNYKLRMNFYQNIIDNF